MIRRVGGVEATAADEGHRSASPCAATQLIPEDETGGIAVVAADPSLPATVGATLARGPLPRRRHRPLPGRRARAPTPPRGSGSTAPACACGSATAGSRWSGSSTPSRSPPGSTRSALVGFDVAEALLGADRSASTIYVRARPGARSPACASCSAPTANPEHPEEVDVSRPSDALEARAAAKTAFTSLFLGLGAVALLVGGVGIANVMVISVLERRSEIGLRRALGATRRHVGVQFLSESLLLAALGGAGRGGARRGGDGRLRGQPGLAGGGAAGRARRRPRSPRRRSARSPGSTRRCARPGCRRPTRCGRCEIEGVPRIKRGARRADVWPMASAITRRSILALVAGRDRLAGPRALRAVRIAPGAVRLAWHSVGRKKQRAGYEVLRDGRRIAQVRGHEYTDRAVAPGARYRYEVRAVAAGGRRGLRSKPVVVRTPARRDPPAPPAPAPPTPPPPPDPIPARMTAAMVDARCSGARASARRRATSRSGPAARARSSSTGCSTRRSRSRRPTTPPLTAAGDPIDPVATPTELVLDWLDKMQRATQPAARAADVLLAPALGGQPRGRWRPRPAGCSTYRDRLRKLRRLRAPARTRASATWRSR